MNNQKTKSKQNVQVIQLSLSLTGWIDVVGEEEIELSDGDVDVVGIDTESRMKTIRRLLQPLTVRALQRNGLEQDHLNQIKSPDLFK